MHPSENNLVTMKILTKQSGPTRRTAMKLALGAVATTAIGIGQPRSVFAANGLEQAILEFTGGVLPIDGDVTLDAPEISDNGGSVQVRVAAAGARRIAIFASANPNPGVAVFSFGESAVPAATTRIRLAGSQDILAVAQLTDGSFVQAKRPITVTVGGCG